MKKIIPILLLFFVTVSTYGQERLSMNEDWSFEYIPKDSERYQPVLENYFYNNRQWGSMQWSNDSLMQLSYDESDWRKVDIPHDYVIEGVPNPEAMEVKGFFKRGIGVYRKTFNLPESDEGKGLWLRFEGAFRNAQIFVNGFKMGSHPSGYTPFRIDISNIAHLGNRENIVVVFTDPGERGEGWWYEGGGIYRPVYLEKSGGDLHFQPDGVAVNPILTENYDSSNVEVFYNVLNREREERSFDIISTIVDQEGNEVNSTSKSFEIGPWQKEKLQSNISVSSPELWSLDDPKLYFIVSEIKEDGITIDKNRTRFGIRDIRFDAEEGMFLNGEHVKIKGANLHQDHGGVGVAVPKEIFREKLRKLKEFGFNGYRAAHHAAAPDFLDVADEEGMLVINEQRIPEARPQYLNELREIIRTSRNHPSVFLYSLANEEYRIAANSFEKGLAENLMREIAQLDPQQRPATMGRVYAYIFDQNTNERVDIPDLGERVENTMKGAGKTLDIAGFNYNDEVMYAYKGPLPIIQTEASGNMSTRGVYETDRRKNWVSSYPSWKEHERLKKFLTTDRISGSFMWTGYDYGGEATPFRTWPGVSSHFGLFDMCGFPKDMAYFYKAVQKPEEPVLHLFPHWNWEGLQGELIKVHTYTNVDEVELFQDGKSLGKREVLAFQNQRWDVEYRPGKLTAKGYIDGELVLTDEVVTAGQASEVRISGYKNSLNADGKDAMTLEFKIVDKDGNLVPKANNIIEITVEGSGRLLGVDNGSPTNINPNKVPRVRAFNGLACAILQAGEEAGDITVKVSSDGLDSNSLIIDVKEVQDEPSVSTDAVEDSEADEMYFREPANWTFQ